MAVYYDLVRYRELFSSLFRRDLRARFLERYAISRVELPLYRYRRHTDNMTNDRSAWETYEQKLREKHSGEPV